MSIIRTEQLSYIYSKDTTVAKAAITDINLDIAKGEFVGIIGHTGSGKSTLVQHFNGLMKPSSGKIYVDGEDLWANPKEIRKFRFKVGLVFQYPEHQLFEETVYKDIAFGPTNMGLTEAEIDARVRQAATLVGLREELLRKSPFELSGGQKRRAAIAGVIAMEPEVLILDEPTAGLDPRGREQILGMVHNYHRHMKNTVLLVSHSMEDVARYANKVLVMNQAKVYLYEDVAEVFSRAEELEGIGLSVPEITRICRALAAKGYPVSPNIYTVEQAREQLLPLLRKGGGVR
ncbi:MAG: energy-coupling factor transporter ATPase [Oscillospiraceae bacterium]